MTFEHRVCAICGKPGGSGFTYLLREVLKIEVPHGKIGYAHANCIIDKRKGKK